MRGQTEAKRAPGRLTGWFGDLGPRKLLVHCRDVTARAACRAGLATHGMVSCDTGAWFASA